MELLYECSIVEDLKWCFSLETTVSSKRTQIMRLRNMRSRTIGRRNKKQCVKMKSVIASLHFSITCLQCDILARSEYETI